MKREQIIKGLKNFITNAHTKIYYPGGDDLIGDALSLIKELIEENERLRNRNITLEQKLMILDREEVPVLKVQVKGE